jgi:hypothetical protein
LAGISGAKDEERDAGETNGPETHSARLEGYTKYALRESPTPEGVSCSIDRDHLRVGGYGASRLSEIMPSADDVARVSNYCSNGNFACGCGVRGFLKSRIH